MWSKGFWQGRPWNSVPWASTTAFPGHRETLSLWVCACMSETAHSMGHVCANSSAQPQPSTLCREACGKKWSRGFVITMWLKTMWKMTTVSTKKQPRKLTRGISKASTFGPRPAHGHPHFLDMPSGHLVAVEWGRLCVGEPSLRAPSSCPAFPRTSPALCTTLSL